MNEVSGTVEKGYEAVRDGFAAGQIPDEGGAQLCVYRHGRKVVDLWTGRDKINNRPYTDQTITVLMSCSKGASPSRNCSNVLPFFSASSSAACTSPRMS